MNRRVPVWLLLLCLVLALQAAVLLAWLVLRVAQGDPRATRVREAVLAVATFPSLARQVLGQLSGGNPLRLDSDLTALDGFRNRGELPAAVGTDTGFLLLSVFDAQRGQSVVRLLRIADQQVVHEWVPDLADLARRQTVPHEFGYGPQDVIGATFRAIHPLPLADGGIVLQNSGPLFKLDACAKVVWTVQGFHHHSIAQDRHGQIWTASAREQSPHGAPSLPGYRDDTIVRVSPDGRLQQVLSITDILLANGYRGLLFGAGSVEPDMIHLNSVQPALRDGRHWRADDLLVSLRHRSTVFVYRPSTGKVVWLQTGPWLNQHSASFVGDHHIGVFGNDVVTVPNQWTNRFLSGGNEIYLVDLDSGETRTPYRQAMRSLDVRTPTDGALQMLDNGDAFVEETNRGRLLRLTPTDARWQYVQRIDAQHVAALGWSRYLVPDEAAPLMRSAAATVCAGRANPGH